jgi:ferredoxin
MIRGLPQFKNTAGFVFSTFGKCVCNTVPYNLARELQAKGVSILGGAQIVMPHSSKMDADTRIGDIEESFGKGEPTAENREKYESVIRDIAGKVESGDVTGINIDLLKKLQTRSAIADIMNVFMNVDKMKSYMPRVQHDSEKCNRCHLCVSNCDYQAVTLSDDEEIFIDDKLCRRCYKCIEECNQQAIYTDWDKVLFWTRFIHRFAKNAETKFVV